MMPNYRIRIVGHLAPRWSEWLDGLELCHEPDGTTILQGYLIDQSALFGVLFKIRDLNVALVSLERIETIAPIVAE